MPRPTTIVGRGIVVPGAAAPPWPHGVAIPGQGSDPRAGPDGRVAP